MTEILYVIINMTSEELAKEFDESTKRFIERMGRDIKIVSHPSSQN